MRTLHKTIIKVIFKKIVTSLVYIQVDIRLSKNVCCLQFAELIHLI